MTRVVIAIVLLSISCSQPEPTPARSAPPMELSSEPAPAPEPEPLPTPPANHHWVLGQASVYTPWCGGAAPPRDLDEYAPATQSVILFRRGKKNSNAKPVAEITTGREGEYRVALEPGAYCAVFASKRRFDAKKVVSPGVAGVTTKQYRACMKARFEQCSALIEVKAADQRGIRLIDFRGCSWSPPCVPVLTAPPASAPGR